MQLVAVDVAVIPTLMSNAYLVGDEKSWILVDALTPGHQKTIKEAAEARFGRGAKPQAIVLTHGHFDHAGSARELADAWGVKVYAHRLELPYLTGKSVYPPLDPTTEGFFSRMSRFIRVQIVTLGERICELDSEAPLRWVEGWECRYTPGHAPGHLAFYRRRDGILLAGDAVTTMDLDSALGTITQQRKVCRPPTPGTIDWEKAAASVRALAELRPKVIAAGHGRPMRDDTNRQLQRLAQHFRAPKRGRYVRETAQIDETGVTYLPPAPFDGTPIVAAAVAAGTMMAATAMLARRRRRQ